MRRSLYISILCILPISLFAQDLPEQLHFNEDRSRLIHGGMEVSGFYETSLINTINLEFYDTDFWERMINNYNTENYVLATLSYKGTSYDSVAVQFKGQTSFTKALKSGSEKLSFSVKLDEIIEGQDIDGYNNLNLNNAYQDLTFMREVLYGNLSRTLGPALKGNYIRLSLNGDDWGLYTNIQQLNGDYIKEWYFDKDGIRWRADAPAASKKATLERPGGGSKWGDGTSALNYLGETSDPYQQYYTLKDSDMDNPWEYLVKVCDVLNNAGSEHLYDSLSVLMDMDATLWFLARENLFSDDDSYIYKGRMDYYLYLNEESGKMTPMEFDGNSVMQGRNANWPPFMNSDSVNYPLLNVLLQIPELRQRYIAHYKTFMKYAFHSDTVFGHINGLDQLIAPQLMTDPKIDFPIQAYAGAIISLKEFFNEKEKLVAANPEFQYESPLIFGVSQRGQDSNSNIPVKNEKVILTTRATHPAGIKSVFLHYSMGLNGNFIKLAMRDDGMDEDEVSGDGVFTAAIPAQKSNSYVRYYIESIADDNAFTTSFMPEGAEYDVFVYQVYTPTAETQLLALNEILASNNTVISDNYNEYDDCIEIYNLNSATVSLDGFHLSDNSDNLFKWAFPDTSVEAGGYILVWADEDSEQGAMHANFKLSSGGEELILTNADSAIVDQIVFNEQETDFTFGRWPNGTGSFIQMLSTLGEENTQYITGTSMENNMQDEFCIYPNPTDGLIHISTPDPHSDVRIYNTMGKIFYQGSYQKTLDLSSFPPGLYFLKTGSYIGKIIVR